MPRPLTGLVALVTGAARGIGRAIAVELADQGAAVVVNDIAEEATIAGLASEISARGGRALAVRADAADLSTHATLIERTFGAFGRLDILVNNAGIARRGPFLETTPAMWDEVMGLNLRAMYFLSQASARRMKDAGGGKIINISSVHEERPMPHNTIYSISKAGVAMLTKALAVELAEHGIQVNGVAPGAIRTEATQARLDEPACRASVLAKIPMRSVGEPLDVARAAAWLASPETRYVTGATLDVDGGMRL